MSSRIILSTSISTILVLLSYVWYRRRARLSEFLSRSNHYHSAEAEDDPCSLASNESSRGSPPQNETLSTAVKPTSVGSGCNRVTEATSCRVNQTPRRLCRVSETEEDCSQISDSEAYCSDTVSDRDDSSSCSCDSSYISRMGRKKRQAKVKGFDPDVPTRESMERAMLVGRKILLAGGEKGRMGHSSSGSLPSTSVEKTVSNPTKRSPQTRQTSLSGLSDDFSDLRVSDSAIESSGETVRPKGSGRPGKNYSISSNSDVEGPVLSSVSDVEVQKYSDNTEEAGKLVEVCNYVDSASHSPGEDMLASPAVSNCGSDFLSEGSSDSGKGGSDSTESPNSPIPPNLTIHEFEIAQMYCPRLIGRHGCFIQDIKSSSGATVMVKTHPLYDDNSMKLVSVEGTETEVTAALKMIRKRFPERKFKVNLERWLERLYPINVPEIMLLSLPQDVSCDVILSSVVTPSHIFLQQPTHPSYPSLQELQFLMTLCYSSMETPPMPASVEVGSICAAPMFNSWHRAQVISCIPSCTEDNPEGPEFPEADIKFLDHGGYSRLPIANLRQIRSDFLALHFQATECYLANLAPKTDAGWTMDGMAALEELAHGVVLQAQVAYYSPEGIPCIHLYRFDSGEALFINRELVNQGLALWVDNEC